MASVQKKDNYFRHFCKKKNELSRMMEKKIHNSFLAAKSRANGKNGPKRFFPVHDRNVPVSHRHRAAFASALTSGGPAL